MFKEKYELEKLSIAQISSQFLCSKDTVRRNLKANGAQIREPRQHHGRPSQPRYGEQYRNGKLVRHLGEARVKRTVLEMRETGLSLRQIAKFLDHIGVPTKCRGKKWHPEMVKRILERDLIPVPTTDSEEGPRSVSTQILQGGTHAKQSKTGTQG